MNTTDVLPGAPPIAPRAQPVSVGDPLAEWLARTGYAGAYERFVALAAEILPKGTTFESTLEMHPGNEPMVECVAMCPADTNGIECERRFIARYAEYPVTDRNAPIALLIRWSDQWRGASF